MFEVYVYCKESVLQRKRERAVNIVLFFQLEKEEETICYERTVLLVGWLTSQANTLADKPNEHSECIKIYRSILIGMAGFTACRQKQKRKRDNNGGTNQRCG